MKNHTFSIDLSDSKDPMIIKITIPEGYDTVIEPGDTVDETWKVIGHSKVDPKQVICTNRNDVIVLSPRT